MLLATFAAVFILVQALVLQSEYASYTKQVVDRRTTDMYQANLNIRGFFVRNVAIFKTLSILPEIVDQEVQGANRIFSYVNSAFPHVANAAAVGGFFPGLGCDVITGDAMRRDSP